LNYLWSLTQDQNNLLQKASFYATDFFKPFLFAGRRPPLPVDFWHKLPFLPKIKQNMYNRIGFLPQSGHKKNQSRKFLPDF